MGGLRWIWVATSANGISGSPRWVVRRRSAHTNIALVFPGRQLLLVVVLGVVLGYVSAILPARRATRAEVLDAIQAT